MTQEQKDLLLKDLCARLPYGVKGKVSSRDCNNRECDFVATIGGKLYDRFAVAQELWFDNVTIKPYLFPLSSMTEEQKEKALSLLRNCDYYLIDGIIKWLDNCPIEFFDWCNKHHFDYRGLIEKGLAIDATELNIY